MIRYVIRRILQMLPTLLAISVISFGIVHLAPGDPLLALIGEESASADTAKVEMLRQEYGFDQPVYVQYAKWLTKVVQGDFGKSIVEQRSVLEMIGERLPNTLYLNVITLVLTYVIGIPLGVVTALRQYSAMDYGVTSAAYLMNAMPTFWIGLMMIYFFSVNLQWLPTSGMHTIGYTIERKGFLVYALDTLKYTLMPATVLVLGSLSGLTRYVRAQMLEVVSEDYVRTARAKGLSERVIIYKHALRNALLPVITNLSLILPGLFGGAVIIETVFSWPGLGLLAIRAINQRDYPVIMAFNTIGAVLVVISILLVDLVYVLVDPRIKYS